MGSSGCKSTLERGSGSVFQTPLRPGAGGGGTGKGSTPAQPSETGTGGLGCPTFGETCFGGALCGWLFFTVGGSFGWPCPSVWLQAKPSTRALFVAGSVQGFRGDGGERLNGLSFRAPGQTPHTFQ